MLRSLSFYTCLFIGLVLIFYRLFYSDIHDRPLRVTTWDAFGYYMYLPGAIIYNDLTHLNWYQEIENRYHMSGGNLYQASKQENGKYVFKYLGGVAILELPYFLLAHGFALLTSYPADGFSPPYQYGIGFGVLLSCLIGVFLLRKILLNYFNEQTTAITLLLIMLATNIIQYAAIDNAMSHGPIFPLYALVLYASMKWHSGPSKLWAIVIGLTIGIATISRPTELIMLFIPLLWNTHNKEAAKSKWLLVKKYRSHLLIIAVSAFVGILPQLVYWKIATGSFIYDVGSKWSFLNPFFRVLIGWEKGWFIYTPVTIFFIAGLFLSKRFPFRKSVLWFCLLNIWIVISWFDWRYGGSYSTRALSQSYPVFALPLAAFVTRFNSSKWKWFLYIASVYLIIVNLFQVFQYNKMIIHYDDMNFKYYSKVYMNTDPSPLDMSLLDTDDYVEDETAYQQVNLIDTLMTDRVALLPDSTYVFLNLGVDRLDQYSYLKADVRVRVKQGLWNSWFCIQVQTMDSLRTNRIRLHSPISEPGKTNTYQFYMSIPESIQTDRLKVFIEANEEMLMDTVDFSLKGLKNRVF